MPWNIWHRMTACLLLCAGMSLTGCCGPSRPEPIRPPASLLREGPPLPSPVPVYEAIKAATDEEGRLRAALHFVGYVNGVTARHRAQEADKAALRDFYDHLEKTGE